MQVLSETSPNSAMTANSAMTEGVGSTMMAITQRAYGSADVLSVETIARPTPEPDEVLLQVEAAGLDRGVWHLMTGTPYLVRLMGFGLRAPKNPVPGLDVAGRVVAVGSAVTRFVPGDEVFGIATGSFAEYATAKEAKLVVKPAGVPFEQAAVATVSGITALQALVDVGRVQAGHHVLVIGASGGVGSYAVQLAKALGATVTGVASTSKLDAVRSLGADHLIDYTTTAIDEVGHRFDLIIDTGGRNPLSRIRRALTPDGTLVIVGGEGGDRWTGGIGRQLRAAALSPFVRQRLAFFMSEESLDYIQPLADHLAVGTVVPAVGRRFDLDQVPEAIEALAAGSLTAKAVIVVRS